MILIKKEKQKLVDKPLLTIRRKEKIMKLLLCIISLVVGVIVGRIIYIVVDETIKRHRFYKEIEDELNKIDDELNEK